MLIHLIVRLIKKILYKNESIFPTPLSDCKIIKVDVDLSNYATKKDINDITHVDTSNFALKTNLSSLKTKVDKRDIDKLVPVPTDLSKLSNVVKNYVVKKTVYDKLAAKVININTSDFVLKTNFNTKLTELENKIPNTNGLPKKADYNTKITERENKIPDISGLATKTALTTVENKIPSISNLATKTELTAVENKIPSIAGLVKKKTIILRLLILKIYLIIIIMINMLLLQSSILYLLMFLMQDQHKQI